MRIGIGADHAGRQDKTWLVGRLRELGHAVEDFGTHSDAPSDYPDYAAEVARAVSEGRCDRGVLICGTGIGMSMAANKVPGIRAAACQTVEAARYGRAHNDANVLCVGSRVIPHEVMSDILDMWLSTAFEGGRHERRVEKINRLDEGKLC